MFSVSPAEFLAIAVVALLVFGPGRLPEITRKADKAFALVVSTAHDLRTGLEAEPKAEHEEVIDSIRDTGTEMRSAITGLDRDAPRPPEDAGPLAAIGFVIRR